MSKSVVRLWSSPWRCVTQKSPKSTTVEYRSSEKTYTDGSRAVQSFHEIPGIVLSRNDALKKALFGIFNSKKKNSMSMHFNTIKKYGEIAKISTEGISERESFVLVANPEDIATVFRNIGPNPYRPGMEVLKQSLDEERKHASGLVWRLVKVLYRVKWGNLEHTDNLERPCKSSVNGKLQVKFSVCNVSVK